MTLDQSGVSADALRGLLLRNNPAHLVCKPDSLLCVGGYPRSANTFVSHVLASRLPQRRLSHHLHDARNLKLAETYQVPTLVLIRRPADAILSYHIYIEQPFEVCADRYLRFYETVLQLQPDYVLGRFEDVTRDVNTVLTTLNDRYGLGLALSDDPGAELDLFQAHRNRTNRDRGDKAFRKAAMPTAAREALKASLSSELSAYLATRPDVQAIYNEVTGEAS